MFTLHWQYRSKYSAATGGMSGDVPGGHVEVINYASDAKAVKLPIGWFSDRKRIAAHSGIRVARFHVWQDLTALVDGNLAPLHATIRLELSNEWYTSLSRLNGIVRIMSAASEDVIEAGLIVHEANFGLASSQPTLERQLQFVMSPTPPHRKFSKNETVYGIAHMKFWKRKVKIILPETEVQFRR